MKILVPIKRTVDHKSKILFTSDNNIDLNGSQMRINPYCEVALEEAIQLKEREKVTEVVVVSVGDKACEEQLRSALSLGADRAIHVETKEVFEPLIVAKVLAEVVKLEGTEFILMGKKSHDFDNGITGQMLAGLLGASQATSASSIDFEGKDIVVRREIKGGQQFLRVMLPAVITVDLSLNIPRYASLPSILKAKRKPIETIQAHSLGVDLSSRSQIINLEPQVDIREKVIVNNVDELISKINADIKGY